MRDCTHNISARSAYLLRGLNLFNERVMLPSLTLQFNLSLRLLIFAFLPELYVLHATKTRDHANTSSKLEILEDAGTLARRAPSALQFYLSLQVRLSQDTVAIRLRSPIVQHFVVLF